jgi:hypothetical protein
MPPTPSASFNSTAKVEHLFRQVKTIGKRGWSSDAFRDGIRALQQQQQALRYVESGEGRGVVNLFICSSYFDFALDCGCGRPF